MTSYHEPGSWGTNMIDSRILYDDAGRSTRTAGDVETADRRGHGDFPAAWGEPVGSPYSEQRAAWVAEQVAAHQAEAWIRGGSARAALAMINALAD